MYIGKGLAQRMSEPIGRRRDGEGACPSRRTGLEGNSPKWRHAVRQGLREKQFHFGVRKRSHGMVVMCLFCFRLYPFFKPVQKGFPDLSHILQTPSL